MIINSENYIYALITILGSTFYCIGGLLTLKIREKKNENVTTSTTLWSVIFLMPLSLLVETPWNANPTLSSTLSLLYLGVIATGLAWLIRFRILTVNGLVFQTQVAYLIPIFGIIFGYFLMDEIITWRVLVSLAIILTGIYIFKKIIKVDKINMGTESIEASFLSIFALITFFIFLIISKFSHKIKNGALLD